MAISKEEVLEAISSMSVLDLSELIKEMEEKFGVSAATMAVAAAPTSSWRWCICRFIRGANGIYGNSGGSW